jgi:hypothetical protein
MRSRGLSRMIGGPVLVVAALLAWPGAAGAARPPNTAATGGHATLTIGRPTAQGKRARLPVRCSGTRGATCFVIISMVVRETARGKVIAFSTPLRHRRIKLVDVGGITESCPAGRSDTVPLPLYANGTRLLARHHPLQVRITVQKMHFQRVARTTVTFGT